MSVSILVLDDEPDVAELFRQRFRGETRQGKYVLHYATSGADALDPGIATFHYRSGIPGTFLLPEIRCGCYRSSEF
jgi:hypothetical protein